MNQQVRATAGDFSGGEKSSAAQEKHVDSE
jgi:hypothetical protein